MKWNPELEQYRERQGSVWSTKPGDTEKGLFFVPLPSDRRYELKILAHAGIGNSVPPEMAGWEHVSVSLPHRCPSWQEMCLVKDLFWDAEEVVCQFHPKKSDYVNYAPYCLHLWAQVGRPFSTPPSTLVGPKG